MVVTLQLTGRLKNQAWPTSWQPCGTGHWPTFT